VFNSMKSRLALLGGFAVLAATQTQAALVTVTEGVVSWDASALVGPLTTAVIAAIGGAVTLYIIIRGVRFVFRLLKA
jgi:hypothetical protein